MDLKPSPMDRRKTSEPVDINDQKDWHGEYRDLTRNQYRSCYHDMILNREVAVKSTKPSGYGGHVANVGADVLFNNTLFAEAQEALRTDEHRQRLPDFDYQLAGLPVHTMNPRTRGGIVWIRKFSCDIELEVHIVIQRALANFDRIASR